MVGSPKGLGRTASARGSPMFVQRLVPPLRRGRLSRALAAAVLPTAIGAAEEVAALGPLNDPSTATGRIRGPARCVLSGHFNLRRTVVRVTTVRASRTRAAGSRAAGHSFAGRLAHWADRTLSRSAYTTTKEAAGVVALRGPSRRARRRSRVRGDQKRGRCLAMYAAASARRERPSLSRIRLT
jgi:hypothetical protein